VSDMHTKNQESWRAGYTLTNSLFSYPSWSDLRRRPLILVISASVS
jgi:hypothetical protein